MSDDSDKQMVYVGRETLYAGKSFGVLPITATGFRLKVIQLVDSLWFERFILFLVVVNSIIIASNPDPSSNSVGYFACEVVFTCLFTCEMILRLIASGAILGETAYLRSGWNVLDFVVVFLGWLSIFFDTNLTALRAFRILRALRTIRRVRGMRVLIETLTASLPALMNIGLIVVFTLIMFTIFGIQIWNGRLRQTCVSVLAGGPNDGLDDRCSQSEFFGRQCSGSQICLKRADNPSNGFYSYDHFGLSALAVVRALSLDHWYEMYSYVADAWSQWAVVFFVLITLFGFVYGSNLVLATLFDTYSEIDFLSIRNQEVQEVLKKARETRDLAGGGGGDAVASAEEEEENPECLVHPWLWFLQRADPWLAEFRKSEKTLKREYLDEASGFYVSVRWLVDSPGFHFFMALCIWVNIGFYASETADQSEEWDRVLFGLNLAFLVIFVIEMVLKFIGCGFVGYFADGWNRLDFIIVFVSVFEIFASAASVFTVFRALRALRVFRALRALRTFRFFRYTTSLQYANKAVKAAWSALQPAFFVLLLMSLFMFIGGVIGRQLFGAIDEFDPDSVPNFQTLYWSFVSVFVFVTGKGWTSLMYRVMAADVTLGVVFSLLVFFLGHYIFINFFIVILFKAWENTEAYEDEESEDTDDKLARANAANARDDVELGPIDNDRPRDVRFAEPADGGDGGSGGGGHTPPPRAAVADSGSTSSGSDDSDSSSSSSSSEEEEQEEDLSAWAGWGAARNEIAWDAAPSATFPPLSRTNNNNNNNNNNRSYTAAAAGSSAEFSEATEQEEAEDEPVDERTLPGDDAVEQLGLVARSTRRSWIQDIVITNDDIDASVPLHLLGRSRGGDDGVLIDTCGGFTGLGFGWEIVVDVIIVASTAFLLAGTADTLANRPLADIVFTAVFALELGLRVLTYGPASCITNFYVLIDVVSLVCSLVAVAAGGPVVFLRGVRVLRMWRVFARSRRVRVVIHGLEYTFYRVAGPALLGLIIWFTFSLAGMQLFMGRLSSCEGVDVPPAAELSRKQCFKLIDELAAANVTGADVEWVPNRVNFDNVANAMRTMFSVVMLTDWVDVMRVAVSGVARNEPPVPNGRPAAALFFVIFIVIAVFFVLPMILAIIVDTFVEASSVLTGTLYGRHDEKFAHLTRYLTRVTGTSRTKWRPPNVLSWARMPFYTLVTTGWFEPAVLVVIAVNTVYLCLVHYNQTAEWNDFLSICNMVFVGLFTGEAVAKIIGLGSQYFTNAWELYDFLIVLVSYVGILLEGTVGSSAALSFFRVLRITRVFRFVGHSSKLSVLFFTVVYSIPGVAAVTAVLLVALSSVAVMAGSANVTLSDSFSLWTQMDKGANMPMWLLFAWRVTTLDFWGPGDCGVGDKCSAPVAFFMVLLAFPVVFVIAKLYVVAVFEPFGEAARYSRLHKLVTLLKDWRHAWNLYDTGNAGWLKADEFVHMMAETLEPPLQVDLRDPRTWPMLEAYPVPVTDDGRIEFMPAFDLMTQLVLRQRLESPEMYKLNAYSGRTLRDFVDQ